MQTIFPELKMRAVVRGSLILMITAANLYKFKGGPDRNLVGPVFLFSLATINTFKACHNTYLLFKCFFTTLKLFSTHLGAGELQLQSQDHWDPSALRKGSEGKALSPGFTFGLYSAFLACRAMFFRSSLQAKFTVDTIFLRNRRRIFLLQKPATAEPPPSSAGLMWSHIPIKNCHQLISCLFPTLALSYFWQNLSNSIPKLHFEIEQGMKLLVPEL